MKPAILIVDDEESDRLFLKLAFENAGITNPVVEAGDGREALDYFAGTGRFARREDFPLPCLVLLDLKLPYVMGLEVLKLVRADPALCTMIVLILTASDQATDIEESYRLGANAYLVKPTSIDKLRHIVDAINSFWLLENHSPPAFILPTQSSVPASFAVAH